MEKNYGLRISNKNVEISEENNTWGAAGRYPTIDLGIRSTNRYDRAYDPTSKLTSNNITPSEKILK